MVYTFRKQRLMIVVMINWHKNPFELFFNLIDSVILYSRYLS